MILALLLACQTTTECVTEAREVDDDTVLGDLGFTVAEMAEALVGTRTFTTRYPDETGTDVTLTVARGTAAATFFDTRWEETGTKLGFAQEDTLMHVECEPSVSVPFETTAVSVNPGVDASGSAAVRSLRDTAGPGDAELIGAIDDAGVLTPEDAEQDQAALWAVFTDGELVDFAVSEDGEEVLRLWTP